MTNGTKNVKRLQTTSNLKLSAGRRRGLESTSSQRLGNFSAFEELEWQTQAKARISMRHCDDIKLTAFRWLALKLWKRELFTFREMSSTSPFSIRNISHFQSRFHFKHRPNFSPFEFTAFDDHTQIFFFHFVCWCR